MKIKNENKLNRLNGLNGLNGKTPRKMANGKLPMAKRKVSPLMLLLPYQRRWVEDDSRLKIGVWSRQTGKSLCTAGEAVIDCIRDPGTSWVCLSAGERQALEWLAKAKTWTRMMQAVVHAESEHRDSAEALLRQA